MRGGRGSRYPRGPRPIPLRPTIYWNRKSCPRISPAWFTLVCTLTYVVSARICARMAAVTATVLSIRSPLKFRSVEGLGETYRGTMTPLLVRSEEHTSELQSRLHLVCRLLLEKKKKDSSGSKNVT